ncbi:MAG: TorF family putative porin [Gallionella sp.]
MKSNLLNSLILAALALPSMAMAADAAPEHTVTSNVGIVSDYVFRGITQNLSAPAIQGGFDYAHSSGLYAGVWGSNVGWITGSGAAGNASLEVDTYAGYKGAATADVSYDIGAVRYNYLGTYTPAAGGYVKADTAEAYGSIAYQWLSAKYSYALGDFLTVPKAQGTSYLELNASYALADTGYTLGAHYGKQTYKGTFASTLAATTVAGINQTATYSDYKLSVTKDISGYVLGLAYTNTDTKQGGYYTWADANGVAKNWGKSAVAVSLTHAM